MYTLSAMYIFITYNYIMIMGICTYMYTCIFPVIWIHILSLFAIIFVYIYIWTHFDIYIYIHIQCSNPRTVYFYPRRIQAWRAAGQRFAPESIASWALKYMELVYLFHDDSSENDGNFQGPLGACEKPSATHTTPIPFQCSNPLRYGNGMGSLWMRPY